MARRMFAIRSRSEFPRPRPSCGVLEDPRGQGQASRTTRLLLLLLLHVSSMRTDVSKTVSNGFAALCRIRSIRQCVSRQVTLSMVVSLVLQRLDYGNATLVGLPACQLRRLQSVLNAAALLVLSRSKYTTTSHHFFRSCIGLRIEQRIEFKLSVLVFRCLNGLAPLYLSCDLYTTCVRPGGSSTPAFLVNVDARRPADTPFYRR